MGSLKLPALFDQDGLAAGFLVYYQQRGEADQVETTMLRSLLQQELSQFRRLLMHGEPAQIVVGTETYRPLITFLQPLAVEKAAQSGQFGAIDTSNMLQMAGKIRTYNLQVQFFMSALAGSSTDPATSGRLKFALSNLQQARSAILYDIEFEAKRLGIVLIEMNDSKPASTQTR